MTKHAPTDRINYSGDLTSIIEAVCEAYDIGSLTSFEVIETGYEDCNVAITTSKGKFLAKLFTKTRTPDSIQRYAQVIQQALAAGVRHPELLQTLDGQSILTAHGVSLILLRFVEGKTFYELGRAPTAAERRSISASC